MFELHCTEYLSVIFSTKAKTIGLAYFFLVDEISIAS